MILAQRYAILTVDTEALSKRAAGDHVKRVIWGVHDKGTAGIREMCAIGREFNARHVFFVDLCATYPRPDEMREVVGWLDNNGQDVQLHAHPEVLPKSFWESNGFDARPRYMNECMDDARAAFVIEYFGKQITEVTGKNILAFRAGSFRWNASTIRALKAIGVPLSFNNTMRAYRNRQCVYSEPTNRPYTWSNGVIEVPVTEKCITAQTDKDERWVSLTYPQSSYFPYSVPKRSFLPTFLNDRNNLSVFLLHSWSLLYWDENGHAIYRDDQRLEGYRSLLSRVTKDYDVITTRDFLDLYSRGKIQTTHTVNINNAELKK